MTTPADVTDAAAKAAERYTRASLTDDVARMVERLRDFRGSRHGQVRNEAADLLLRQQAVIGELREALQRIAATFEVVGSETDDGEVDIQTELSEWEMSNLARAALAKAR